MDPRILESVLKDIPTIAQVGNENVYYRKENARLQSANQSLQNQIQQMGQQIASLQSKVSAQAMMIDTLKSRISSLEGGEPKRTMNLPPPPAIKSKSTPVSDEDDSSAMAELEAELDQISELQVDDVVQRAKTPVPKPKTRYLSQKSTIPAIISKLESASTEDVPKILDSIFSEVFPSIEAFKKHVCDLMNTVITRLRNAMPSDATIDQFCTFLILLLAKISPNSIDPLIESFSANKSVYACLFVINATLMDQSPTS